MFSGSRKEKSTGQSSTLQLYSRPPHRKYDPVYRLEAIWTDGATGAPKILEATAPFMKFFSADGYFVPAAFETWLRESIPGLGDQAVGGSKTVDVASKASVPAPVVHEQPKQLPTGSVLADDEEDDDVVLVGSEMLQGASQASARDVAPTPAGKKRSKRKA